MKTKINFKTIFKVVKKATSDHLPEILMGFGIASMVVSTVEAVSSTKDAIEAIDERKEELGLDEDEKLPVKETIKVAGKFYIPSFVAGAVGIGCLIGSNSVHAKRYSALMAAYALSDSTLQEYQKKVVDLLGEDKEKEIQSKINSDALKSAPAEPDAVTNTGNGTDLFFDKLTSRYFLSSQTAILDAVNKLNWEMTRGCYGYISLNEFYDSIGLESMEPLGDTLGWNSDRGLIEAQFDSKLDQHGHPCVVLYFATPPKYGFQDWK